MALNTLSLTYGWRHILRFEYFSSIILIETQNACSVKCYVTTADIFGRVIIISSEWLNTFLYLNIRKLTKAKPNTYFNNLVLDLTDAEHYIYFNPQQLISIVNCDFIQYPILVCLLKHCLWHRNSSHPFSFKADCHIIAYRW